MDLKGLGELIEGLGRDAGYYFTHKDFEDRRESTLNLKVNKVIAKIEFSLVKVIASTEEGDYTLPIDPTIYDIDKIQARLEPKKLTIILWKRSPVIKVKLV